jgi:hypothetical protein
MKQIFYLLLCMSLSISVTAQTKKTTTKSTTKTVTTTKPKTATTKPAATKPAPVMRKLGFTTFVNNNSILVSGDMMETVEYLFSVTDKKGEVVYGISFIAEGSTHNFDMGKEMPKGEYMITLQEKNNPFSTGTITLVLN